MVSGVAMIHFLQACGFGATLAMPFPGVKSAGERGDLGDLLTPDDVYALVAWLLHQDGIIPKDAVMDATTLPAVTMPNREGFVSDSQPDVLPLAKT
jgi:hypothetical protein